MSHFEENNFMKILLSVILSIGLGLVSLPLNIGGTELQESDFGAQVEEVYENYVIYDEEGNFLTEKRGVALGDIIIDSKFDKYEVIYLDDENHFAKARFVESLVKPKVHKKVFDDVAEVHLEKKIGLYSTHNDESYITGDGTESVYGKGGIHDIGNLLAVALRKKNLDVKYDETLHIPHNSSAYTRSRVTAKGLLDYGASAIFDIHRDGASRSFYLTNYAGKNYSKVRIVIGQSNPNKEANLQFALWLVSVAESLYPWLIADIYLGSGKYNQDLSSKAILFEMGCHKIEKKYVENTVPVLADVIYTTLFGTTVEEESGNLTIGTPETDQVGTTVDEVLEESNPYTNKKSGLGFVIVGAVVFVGALAALYVRHKKKRDVFKV